MDQQSSLAGNLTNLTALAWNNSQQALVFTLNLLENASSEEAMSAHRVRLLALNQLASPTVLVTAILLVFLCSPTIIIGNSLVLIAIYRFKRLRTPSNYLVMSLASSDLGVGMYMPLGMYLELCGVGGGGAGICLLNYSIPITLCCVSVLVMVAIAVDRFTSLARPLRYNNLITHTAMERYIAVFWIYAALVGISPFTYHMFYGTPNYQLAHCSFGNLIPRPIQLFMFCAVYGPSAFILLVCYGYIYVVARGHARAISEVRHSLQYAHGSAAPRYGLALAITTGMFLTLWLPFQICMLLDVFTDSKILTHWIVIYLALPIVSSSAFNPWIYGYRNAELRLAVQKVVDDVLTLLGFNYRSQPIEGAHAVPPSIAATAGDAGSYFNQHAHALPPHHLKHSLSPDYVGCQPPPAAAAVIKREYYSWNPDDEFLLVPIAKPESSGFLSLDDARCANNNNHLNISGRSLNHHFVSECAKKCKRKTHLNFSFVKDIKEFNKGANKEFKDFKDLNDLTDEVQVFKETKELKEFKETKEKEAKDDLKAELDRYKDFDIKYNRMKSDCSNRPGLKGSKSMIESFAGLRNGTDVWIFKGKNLMINGASIV